jgi:Spy/CpxP family protein refolding chaperone
VKIRILTLCSAMLLPIATPAQETSPAPPKPGPRMGVRTFKGNVMYRREMGKWWKDSTIAQKLQLNDGQIAQLDQVFYDHKLKLIDFGAEMQKEDLKLQNLLDADVPNEGQISSQVDRVLAARGRLEREYTMMNLDLRKVLSLDQWHQLKAIRAERGPAERVFFFRKEGVGGSVSGEPPAPPPPGERFTLPLPPPPPEADDMF